MELQKNMVIYRCGCGHFSARYNSFVFHLWAFHKISVEKLSCKGCELAFETKGGLARHLWYDHKTGACFISVPSKGKPDHKTGACFISVPSKGKPAHAVFEKNSPELKFSIGWLKVHKAMDYVSTNP